MNLNDRKIKTTKVLYVIFVILYVAIIIFFLFYGKGWNKVSSETIFANKILDVVKSLEMGIVFLLFSFSLFKYKLSNGKNAALEYEASKEENKGKDFTEEKIDSRKNLYKDYFIIIMLIGMFIIALLYNRI